MASAAQDFAARDTAARLALRRVRSTLAASTAGIAILADLSGTAAAQGVTNSFIVGGNVTAPRTFKLSDLQALPAITENVTFLAGTATTNTTFTGVSLFSLLNNTVGIKTDPAVKQDILRDVVIAAGSDGFQAVFSSGEINPTFGGAATQPALVAFANAPGQLLTTDGFARTTAPGDVHGGRYVSNVASLTVFHAPIMSGPFPGGLSTSFTVTGAVTAPATFNLASLLALPATTVTVASPPAATFTGVSLFTLLNTVGVTTNPAVKNNLERDFVIATGSDGFQATVSLGEIDPAFGGNTANPDIVAYATNGGAPGTSLGANGFARLITPNDIAHGRFVSNLVNLEVFDVSNWKILAGETIDLGNFSYQTLGLTLAGGTLTSSGGPGVLTAPTYTLNGGLIDTNAILGSTGAVTQAGGTTVLKGMIATPDVTIAGGTLQLGANGRLAAATTLKLTAGNFDLNGFTQTVATLGGAGNVLLSSNTSGGILTVGAGDFSGVIANNGSQPGSLIVSGPGTLTLAGNSTYTGSTTVNGGTLAVNGSIATSKVTVNPGGTLGGNGTVGATTIAGGTLSPGNSIGTLTVNGALSFSAASVYAVEVSPAASDRTNVIGAASLAGTVQATVQPGSYVPKDYTILSANSLTGIFGSLNTSGVPSGLSASLFYAPTAVTLDLTSVLASTGGLNRNQFAVASGIDNGFNNGGGASGALAGLYGSPASALPGAFSQLSGEIATGAPTASFQVMDQFIGAMLDPTLPAQRLDGAATARGLDYSQVASLDPSVAAAPASPAISGWSAWGAGFGASGNFSGNGAAGSSRLSVTNGGGAAGLDRALSRDTVIGLAVGGGSASWGLSGLGSGDAQVFQIGAYGSTRWDDFYLSGGFAYGHNDMSTDRTVSVAGVTDRLTADFDADVFSGRVEAGRRFGIAPNLGLTPYAAVQVQSFDAPRYSERDAGGLAAFALNCNARTTTDPRSELGLRFDSAPVMLDATPLILRGRVAWAHEFAPDRSAAASFQALPFAGFTVVGASQPTDAALVSLGAELKLAENVSLGAKFDGGFSGGTRVFAGTAKLRFTW